MDTIRVLDRNNIEYRDPARGPQVGDRVNLSFDRQRSFEYAILVFTHRGVLTARCGSDPYTLYYDQVTRRWEAKHW